VIIVTAITLEFLAALQVETGCWDATSWHVSRTDDGLPLAFRTFRSKGNLPLRVALTQASEMGMVATTNTLLPLVLKYNPQCIAMTGVCAGRPGKTNLGDVVAGERLFIHDTGKQLPGEVQHDFKTWNLRGDWKVALEHFDFAGKFANAEWWKARPIPYEWQGNWILAKLHDGVANPSVLQECDRFCPQWEDVIAGLWKAGAVEDGGLSITDQGRARIQRILIRHRGSLPDLSPSEKTLPFKVHAAPMGSGTKVIENPEVWSFVSSHMRKTLGLEMEAAALGMLADAHHQRRLDVLVMKGVMDFADHGRDDHFKEYAARASAECAIAFLREHMNTQPRGASGNDVHDFPRSFVGSLERQVQGAVQNYLGDDVADSIYSRLPRRHLEFEFQGLRSRVGFTLVVGDAGQGKTTWLAGMALSESRFFPVVWFPAKTIASDGLSSAIAAAIYGMNEVAKAQELVVLLSRLTRILLVFIDAIDECGDYALLVQQMQNFKAQSALAGYCHVVLTCRTEALRTFKELGFDYVIPPNDARVKTLHLDPLRDSDSERLLWRNGATSEGISEIRRALPASFYGNPLYLKLALKLQRAGKIPERDADWIGAFAEYFVGDIALRLRNAGKGPTKAAVRSALGHLAYAAIQDSQGACASSIRHQLVDSESEGEGTFLERAIQSGILLRNCGKFRFCHALLCEYFTAHHILGMRNISPADTVNTIARLPGRDSLAMLATQSEPSLLKHFARHQPSLIPQFKPDQLDEVTCTELAGHAKHLLTSKYPSERRVGVRILGTLRTPTAIGAAVDWFASLDPREKQLMAHDAGDLFLRLEHAGALAIIVHHWNFFWWGELPWYDLDFSRRIDCCTGDFRARFATYLVSALENAQSNTAEEARLTTAFAYLRDSRLVDRLAEKVKHERLAVYEHRALAHINTDRAMEVYLASREYYYADLDLIRDDQDETGSKRDMIWHGFRLINQDIACFPHDALMRLAKRELQSHRHRDVNFGLELASRYPDVGLVDVYACAVTSLHEQGYIVFHDRMIQELVERMDAGDVVELYRVVSVTHAKKDILIACGEFSDYRIEKLLIDALADGDMVGAACIGLMRLKSYRAGPEIHKALFPAGQMHVHHVIQALGRIRYEPALDDLLAMLREIPVAETESNRGHYLLEAIGLIGGQRAWEAVFERYRARPSYSILSLLIDVPDEAVRGGVHRLLDEVPDTKHLLGSAIWHRRNVRDDTLFMPDETVPPEFSDGKILDALLESARHRLATGVTEATEVTVTARLNLTMRHECEAIALFDSAKAVEFFEDLAGRVLVGESDSKRDVIRFAQRLLGYRGNDVWAKKVVEQELDGIWWPPSERDVGNFIRWPSDIVRSALRIRVERDPEKWLFLFSHFANRDDQPFIQENIAHVSPEVADACRERTPL
jgi:nucleoside phosphorylase